MMFLVLNVIHKLFLKDKLMHVSLETEVPRLPFVNVNIKFALHNHQQDHLVLTQSFTMTDTI